MNGKRIDGNCIDCAYSMTIHSGYRFYACDYQGIMGKKRPCKYGYGCTVKKSITYKLKKEGESDVESKRISEAG